MNYTTEMEKIHPLLLAFTVRDIQVASNMLSWLQQNGVSSDQFLYYVQGWTEINRLHTSGYFTATKDPLADSVRARELEKTIRDVGIRRYARKMRLNTTQFSFPGKGG